MERCVKMINKVNLDEIIEGIELQTDECSSYLNIKTGKVVFITSEEFRAAEEDEPIDKYPEWQRESIEIAREILFGEDYLALPSKYDIDEYSIMEKFCFSIENKKISNYLYNSIRGKGAFRRFKNIINKYNLENDWYRFRDKKIRQIAIDWCEYNGIEYE